jgi:hypothetical protein
MILIWVKYEPRPFAADLLPRIYLGANPISGRRIDHVGMIARMITMSNTQSESHTVMKKTIVPVMGSLSPTKG